MAVDEERGAVLNRSGLDLAAFAAAIEAAWAEGDAGWERLERTWATAEGSPSAPTPAVGQPPTPDAELTPFESRRAEAPAPEDRLMTAATRCWGEGEDSWAYQALENGLTTDATRCWWDAPPWNGRIADDEFRALVAAYVARYGYYTPDLPAREPGLLRTWERERADRGAAPRVAA